jgi:hypothetical protein
MLEISIGERRGRAVAPAPLPAAKAGIFKTFAVRAA